MPCVTSTATRRTHHKAKECKTFTLYPLVKRNRHLYAYTLVPLHYGLCSCIRVPDNYIARVLKTENSPVFNRECSDVLLVYHV